MTRTFFLYIVLLWTMFLLFTSGDELIGDMLGFVVVFVGGVRWGHTMRVDHVRRDRSARKH